ARRAVNPIFSIYCQDGKVRLSKFHEAPPPLNKLFDYTDPATSWYAQLYFFDTKNEVRNRMSAFIDKETTEGVDPSIVQRLIEMLNQSSSVAKVFRIARDWCHSHSSINVELKLLGERTKARRYNKPIVSEVAALITNDFGDGIPTRYIIVNRQDTGPKRILELHPSYMALQYSFLFPYGEDGYHEKKTVTILLRGGRLFQQYLMGAYTAVEEQRLKWTRNNQDTMHVDLYHNVYDVVTRGDINATGLGKRIVLPATFIGGPRYMIQNYQDTMALC
ncbi:ribonuclease H-like domain-containing protein, partial [Tanacetum coccineum]